MKLYPASEIEEKLISNSTETKRLTLLEKKSFSRLQMISHGRHMCIKSIHDSFHTIRLVITSLLMKIFTSHSRENENRLIHLKTIIYNAKLDSMINSYGIPRETLLKSVAKKLTETYIDK